jgi:uncharacterized protein YndB with AHSA1/START domain
MMDLHFERVYPATRDRVWHALTDPAMLERWYMQASGLSPEVGCKFTLHDPDAKGWSGWLDCEVLIADSPHRFVYRSTERKDQLVTDVAWTLSDHPDGTRVRLDHTGFAGWNGMIAGTMLRFGWKGLMKKKLADAIAASVGDSAS